jgi:hypothetical protein
MAISLRQALPRLGAKALLQVVNRWELFGTNSRPWFLAGSRAIVMHWHSLMLFLGFKYRYRLKSNSVRDFPFNREMTLKIVRGRNEPDNAGSPNP